MDAEREAVAVAGDVVEQLIERIGAPAHHVQDRAEHFLAQIAGAVEHNNGRRHIDALRRHRLESVPAEAHAPLALLLRDPAVEAILCLRVDHRAEVSRNLARIAEGELARGAGDHLDDRLSNVLLYAEEAQRRAALAGRARSEEHTSE